VERSISKFLQGRIDAGDFPSAVYLIAEKGEVVLKDALGMAVLEPQPIAANLDTIYDVASLTKVLITALIGAKYIETDRISLETCVAKRFAEFDVGPLREVTFGDLMKHTSGLPAWKPIYASEPDTVSVTAEIASTPLNKDGNVTYSDLNFIIAGALIEQVIGKQLDTAARKDVLEPLDLHDTCFNPQHDLRPRIAASEKGNGYERQMCRERYPDLDIPQSAFRTETIWGQVHDGNAFFMGGVAGHAGLFSTVGDTFKIAQQFLPGYTKLLKPETCELFRTNLTPGMNEDRSFAFQLASTKDSTAGTKMSPESFGHTGFTGTSLWIDPVNERVFILFTNRTHNHDLPFVNINSVRRKFHDLAVEILDNR